MTGHPGGTGLGEGDQGLGDVFRNGHAAIGMARHGNFNGCLVTRNLSQSWGVGDARLDGIALDVARGQFHGKLPDVAL